MPGLALSRAQGAASRLLDRSRSPVERATAPAYRLLAIQTVLIVALVSALGFAVEASDLVVMATLLAGGIALAWTMRWRRIARPADALEASAVILASGMTTGCLSILLATIAPPFRDSALAGADGLLFPSFSWPVMAKVLGHYPTLVGAMARIYSTLLWQPFALVLLLAATGHGAAIWRFVHAWLLALIACVAVFALAPAITAQVHYGFPLGSIPGLTVNAGWRAAAILADVRGGALHELASGSMTGLVTFPSFHAAGATLLGWGFVQAGKFGRPMVALNILMLPTIPLIGSHYFVDVPGGIVIALLAIRATRRAATAQ